MAEMAISNVSTRFNQIKIKIMGEMANDMMNGRSCSYCGVYFKKPHGFPVACQDCHEPGDDVPKATIKEL